jgi:hypothetical protein
MSHVTTLSNLLVFVVLSLGTVVVRADQGVLQSTLTPCPAGGAANNIGDVNVCGVSWTLSEGRAQLTSGGKIQVKVKGLLVNDLTRADLFGTTAGVTRVYATLVCGANGNRAAVASTKLFALSSAGDALIQDKITVPAHCIAPAIVVRESDFSGQAWLAATGY